MTQTAALGEIPVDMPETPVEPATVVTPYAGFAVAADLLDDDPTTAGLPVGVYHEDDPLPADRRELFRVNGRVYTVPVAVDPRITFRFIRAIRRDRSMELAMADMLGEILGDPVLDALADEDLDPDQFGAVMKAVQKYAMSAMNRAGLGN